MCSDPALKEVKGNSHSCKCGPHLVTSLHGIRGRSLNHGGHKDSPVTTDAEATPRPLNPYTWGWAEHGALGQWSASVTLS